MLKHLTFAASVALAVSAARAGTLADPAPRHLSPMPLRVDGALSHISAAGELPDGRVVVTDQNAPAIWIIDGASGTKTTVGSAGGGDGQYVQPGGIYQGRDRTMLILDRAQGQVLVLSPQGRIARTYSIAVRGTSGGSSADIDLQRLDASDCAYFMERAARFAALSGQSGGLNPRAVYRFDAARQVRTAMVNDLLLPEEKVNHAGNMIYSQVVAGSPADGWGVTPDGRVAVVRAVPYRVDWASPEGRLSQGPAIAYDPLPMTDNDKKEFTAKAGPGVSAGMVGGGQSAASMPAQSFAATKPPFDPQDVLVSPAGRVWVLRSAAFGAAERIYDVFDGAGQRVDRVALPSTERLVGFGAASVYVRATAPNGAETLKRYKTS